jgi:uroporphyrin-III C-methyltransferase/precorrin-2 dehydrogenase/sirohydrochlorin ferrochelatase
VDFATVARAGGTLAVYMGLVTLPKLRDGLFAHGLDPETPAALIERGGTPQQRTLFGTLDNLVAHAEGWSTQGPILLLLGAAVARATTAPTVAEVAQALA